MDGTHGSAVASLLVPDPAGVRSPCPVWNPDLPTTEDFRSQWEQIPDNAEFINGFRAQWEQYLSDVDPADHMPTISPPAFAACSWPRRA